MRVLPRRQRPTRLVGESRSGSRARARPTCSRRLTMLKALRSCGGRSEPVGGPIDGCSSPYGNCAARLQEDQDSRFTYSTALQGPYIRSVHRAHSSVLMRAGCCSKLDQVASNSELRGVSALLRTLRSKGSSEVQDAQIPSRRYQRFALFAWAAMHLS